MLKITDVSRSSSSHAVTTSAHSNLSFHDGSTYSRDEARILVKHHCSDPRTAGPQLNEGLPHRSFGHGGRGRLTLLPRWPIAGVTDSIRQCNCLGTLKKEYDPTSTLNLVPDLVEKLECWPTTIERAARESSDLYKMIYPDDGWQEMLRSSPHGAFKHTNRGVLLTYIGWREGAWDGVATHAG